MSPTCQDDVANKGRRGWTAVNGDLLAGGTGRFFVSPPVLPCSGAPFGRRWRLQVLMPGSVGKHPPGGDTYDNDLSCSSGNLTAGGMDSWLVSDGLCERAHSPAYRVAIALVKAVYSSPAKSSHQWASTFDGLSKSSPLLLIVVKNLNLWVSNVCDLS
jgi:hypothetical protein